MTSINLNTQPLTVTFIEGVFHNFKCSINKPKSSQSLSIWNKKLSKKIPRLSIYRNRGLNRNLGKGTSKDIAKKDLQSLINGRKNTKKHKK